MSHADFIRRQTAVAAPPLVPEIRLHLATEITPLWQATEDVLEQAALPPPFWAFAWPGSQALARHVLDRPELVRGRRVLDFAAGSGLAGIAAAMAGARQVWANEIDAVAGVAIALNAALNGVRVTPVLRDVVGAAQPGLEVVLAGDICYERPTAERVAAWLAALARAGAEVLVADPGRAYLPRVGLLPVAEYEVATSRELEDRDVRVTVIYRVLPA